MKKSTKDIHTFLCTLFWLVEYVMRDRLGVDAVRDVKRDTIHGLLLLRRVCLRRHVDLFLFRRL